MVSETLDNVVMVVTSSIFSESLATQARDMWINILDLALRFSSQISSQDSSL